MVFAYKSLQSSLSFQIWDLSSNTFDSKYTWHLVAEVK